MKNPTWAVFLLLTLTDSRLMNADYNEIKHVITNGTIYLTQNRLEPSKEIKQLYISFFRK